MAQQYCERCRKTMADTNFYTYKNGDKAELCKPCITAHINNWEPDSYLWLLEKFDVPYIEAEWNILRDRAFQKDPYKMNGMSVFGKYLSKMKLKQWKDFSWADTERLKAEAEEKARLYGHPDIAAEELENMKRAYENGEITEAQYKTYTEIKKPEPRYETPYLTEPELPMKFDTGGNSIAPASPEYAYPVNSNFEQVELVDVSADLDQEDKIYLAMKWGRLYKADEWVALEKLYNDFMDSFQIQGAARIDTLKMICKTSLKMNQAIDCGDVESYQKLSKVYDSMMKSAKFTEAQKKDKEEQEFDAIGSLVLFCEAEKGKIERYRVKEDQPLDKADEAIAHLKQYSRNLIYNDTNLAQQIEQYLNVLQANEQRKLDKEEAKKQGLDHIELKDEDLIQFNNEIESDYDSEENIDIKEESYEFKNIIGIE